MIEAFTSGCAPPAYWLVTLIAMTQPFGLIHWNAALSQKVKGRRRFSTLPPRPAVAIFQDNHSKTAMPIQRRDSRNRVEYWNRPPSPSAMQNTMTG